MNVLKGDQDLELSNLMRQAQGGDSESYKKLLFKVREILARYIRNSLARFRLSSTDSAEDLIQEALIAIHQKRGTYDSQQPFLPWMYAIARYKVIDHLRKSKFEMNSVVSLDDELENVEAIAAFDEQPSFEVDGWIEALPEKQKKVLLLVKVEGLSIGEAAAKTGFSVSDIKVTVHRAIKTLQEKAKGSSHENG